MPNQVNSVYMPPQLTEQQLPVGVEYGPTLSQEYGDSQFGEIIRNNYQSQKESREAEAGVHRNSLESIFNPQPSQEQIARMMEQISTYLMQEADLIESYRMKRMNGDV